MTATRKVALIGIEGLSQELLRYVATGSEFTYIKNLLDNSTLFELETDLQSTSASSWATIATGVNPGKHGIFGDSKRVPRTYQFVIPNARFRQAKPFWQIIDEYGYKAGVFNVPVSYPPEPVDGFFVAGSDMPSLASPFTYPNGLYLLLTETFGFYKPDVDGSIADKRTYLEDILKLSTHQFEVFEFLANKFLNLDLVLAVFTALDRLLHVFDWKRFLFTQPDAYTEQNETIAWQIFHTFFKQLDKALKKFTEDEDFTVLLVATHGETPIQTEIDLNQWLLEAGFIALNKPSENESSLIDWQHTWAYCPGSYGHIYLNRKGREPNGIVEDGKQAKDIRERIRLMLCKKAQEAQLPLILNILQADDLYWGSQVYSAPDLILDLSPGCRVINKLFELSAHSNLDGISPKIAPSSGHSSTGVLVLSDPGPGIEKHTKQMRLQDVGPTVLSLMGIPILESMDGEPAYRLSMEMRNLSTQEFANEHQLVNVEELQQLVTNLEHALQLKEAELKVQQHTLAPLEEQVANLQAEVVRLRKEVELLRSGKVMRLLLWVGNLINHFKRFRR